MNDPCLASYVSGADGMGYPRPLVTHPPHTQSWGHPGAEARRMHGVVDLRSVGVNADRPCVRVSGSVLVYR
jgi:hypothetical protein